MFLKQLNFKFLTENKKISKYKFLIKEMLHLIFNIFIIFTNKNISNKFSGKTRILAISAFAAIISIFKTIFNYLIKHQNDDNKNNNFKLELFANSAQSAITSHTLFNTPAANLTLHIGTNTIHEITLSDKRLNKQLFFRTLKSCLKSSLPIIISNEFNNNFLINKYYNNLSEKIIIQFLFSITNSYFDIDSEYIKSCDKNNYAKQAYIARIILTWIIDTFYTSQIDINFTPTIVDSINQEQTSMSENNQLKFFNI